MEHTHIVFANLQLFYKKNIILSLNLSIVLCFCFNSFLGEFPMGRKIGKKECWWGWYFEDRILIFLMCSFLYLLFHCIECGSGMLVKAICDFVNISVTLYLLRRFWRGFKRACFSLQISDQERHHMGQAGV